MAQVNEQIPKYKELYSLSMEVLREEDARHANIENKAARYFPAIIALFGGFGFFAKTVTAAVLPIDSVCKVGLLALLVIVLSLLMVASYLFVAILRQRDYLVRPVDVDFFDRNDLAAIYRSLSQENQKAALTNRASNDAKNRLLSIGHTCIVGALTAFFLLFVAFGLSQINGSPNTKTAQETAMSNENQGDAGNSGKTTNTQSTTPQVPEPVTQPQPYDVLKKSDQGKTEKRTR